MLTITPVMLDKDGAPASILLRTGRRQLTARVVMKVVGWLIAWDLGGMKHVNCLSYKTCTAYQWTKSRIYSNRLQTIQASATDRRVSPSDRPQDSRKR